MGELLKPVNGKDPICLLDDANIQISISNAYLLKYYLSLLKIIGITLLNILIKILF